MANNLPIRTEQEISNLLELDQNKVEFQRKFIDNSGTEFLVSRYLINDSDGKTLHYIALRETRPNTQNNWVTHDSILIPRRAISSEQVYLPQHNKAAYAHDVIYLIKDRCKHEVITPDNVHILQSLPKTYITDWINGTPFSNLKEVKTETLVDLVEQVAELNKRGFVHVDLHDENVLQNYAGKAVILDYTGIILVCKQVKNAAGEPVNLSDLKQIFPFYNTTLSNKDVTEIYTEKFNE